MFQSFTKIVLLWIVVCGLKRLNYISPFYAYNWNSFDLEVHFPSWKHVKEVKECGSSEESSSAQNVYDIGDIIVEKLKDITDHEKYVIFKNHFRPGEKYEFKKSTKTWLLLVL